MKCVRCHKWIWFWQPKHILGVKDYGVRIDVPYAHETCMKPSDQSFTDRFFEANL
jgi:hypothetical protein